jgi:2-polyprenyl-3-methyl-5-hydroxy-6-metoxy-1,4-benzoquinol methylase
MDLEELTKIEKEEDRVKALYRIFNEDNRLSSKASRVEFLTTVRQIEKYMKPGMRILDLGAGTGTYSLYLAGKGYDVTAVELVDDHVELIKRKRTEDMKLKVIQGNALDLSDFDDNYFDIILCFGPLYHLESMEDRLKCINGVKRVCSNNGFMFYAFINNDMVITTETICYGGDLRGDFYNHQTFKVVDFPFVFSTVDQARDLLKKCNIQIISEVASDGLSELLADKINAMDDESYNLWLNHHYYCSEKPEFIGASNHLLFIGKK